MSTEVFAAEVPAEVTLGENRLVLNGVGVEEILWTDVYRAALYVPKRSNDYMAIVGTPEAKLLRIEILFNDMPEAMPSDWREVFERHLKSAKLDIVDKTYHRLKIGDTLSFGYLPETGTRISLNGVTLGVGSGYGLMRDLLDLWIGENASASDDLRTALLMPDFAV